MKIKKTIKEFFFRLLRFLGIIILIYVSIVFYMCLTERRNAYPRAITHTEANAAIQNSAKSISCTLEDGLVLEGFQKGSPNNETLLYFPDADEDVAQFFAEIDSIPQITLIAFNYRGSAKNKGTPSADTFEPDSKEIKACASQVNNKEPLFLAGRGIGAILAANQITTNQKLILIDPVWSIADAISYKYRLLFPKFLVRAKESISQTALEKNAKNTIIISDRMQFTERTSVVTNKLASIQNLQRDKLTFKEVFIQSISILTTDNVK